MSEIPGPDRTGPGSEELMRRDLERVVEVAERRRNLIRAVFDRGESSGLVSDPPLIKLSCRGGFK